MIEIFYQIARWFKVLNIDPKRVKITITFINTAEGYHAASQMVSEINTTNLIGPMSPSSLLQEFELFGIKGQFVTPYSAYRIGT